jgi:hypothetical protein
MSNEVTSAPSICMVLSTLTLALLRRAAEFVPVASAPEPMATASVTAAAPNPTTVVIVDALDRASTSAFSRGGNRTPAVWSTEPRFANVRIFRELILVYFFTMFEL